jgi:hypothetical protein
MLEAEIKGKLPEVQRREDILTSNVFGLLKYVRNNIPVLSILDHAKTLCGRKFRDCINVKLEDYEVKEYCFWERLGIYGEPDLIIKFKRRDGVGGELSLCVEVKYYGVKNGEGEDDQLRRYFQGMTDSLNESRFLGIIYLTKYPSSEELKDSLKCIKDKCLGEATNKLFQLRWFEVTSALDKCSLKLTDDYDKNIVKDIVGYLKHKNFVEFTGFTFPKDRQEQCFRTSDRFYLVATTHFTGFSYTRNDFNTKVIGKIYYRGRNEQ